MDRTHPDSGDYITPPMSLRDYFAAQALVGIIARSVWDPSSDAAESAYEYADAMLKARGEK